ncbi:MULTISPECIES: hypothetical protein [Limnochorda]|uniref:hypothetical protein n=1 Tax=Limnochorda TaxID=1676651 RepID=UPI00180091B8|nr:hypothetical protein [Limnochorda pilosa]MBO2485492.1 hypothetical protein [Bacillota bacterium]MBO2518710.1 hypothetical protein [Bacillota bacterium]NMA70819.1 hypothetical protein [Bacillota bacterium]
MTERIRKAGEARARLRRAQNAMMEIGQLARELGQEPSAVRPQARLLQLIRQVEAELQALQGATEGAGPTGPDGGR